MRDTSLMMALTECGHRTEDRTQHWVHSQPCTAAAVEMQSDREVAAGIRPHLSAPQGSRAGTADTDAAHQARRGQSQHT